MIDLDLIERLARLSDDEREAAARRAQALRRRQIRGAVNKIRKALLPYWSDRAVARAIDDVARHRKRVDPLLRATIEAALREDLGELDDLPTWERIRQLFD